MKAEPLRRALLLCGLLARDLLRRRLTALLLFLVPALFHAVALATTRVRRVEVVLAALVEPGAVERGAAASRSPLFTGLADDGLRALDGRALSLVFLGGAAVSFLSGFLAFYLVHRRTDADRRLVLAGFRPAEVLLAKLLLLAALACALAAWQATLLSPFLPAGRAAAVAPAYALGGLVYGCLGLLVGALALHELEGIFLLVLFANVDVGWLQNPIYFEASERPWLIRGLPGHHPTQLALLSAFTDEPAAASAGAALAWAAGLAALAIAAFWLRIRPARPVPLSDRAFYLLALLGTYALWLGTFYPVGWYASGLATRDPTSALDLAIPLWPAAVWAYQLCYLFPFAALFAVRDWHRLNAALLAVLLANALACAVYLTLPIAFPRPALGDSHAERVLALEFAADFTPGANKLPSMHVAVAWLIALASRGGRLGRAGDALLFALAAAITVSTLLVKQHLIVDAVAGVALAFAAWPAARRLYRALVDPAAGPREALLQLCSPARWRRRAAALPPAGHG